MAQAAKDSERSVEGPRHPSQFLDYPRGQHRVTNLSLSATAFLFASNVIEQVDGIRILDQPQHLQGITGPVTDLPPVGFQNLANTSAAGPKRTKTETFCTILPNRSMAFKSRRRMSRPN